MLLCWLLFAVNAQAAVEIAGPPAGWDSGASNDASYRADDWAKATGGRVTDLYSTRASDGFSETLAVLALSGAMRADAELEPESTLEEAVGALFDSDPESVGVREADSGAPIITGVWDEADITYEVAVVSAGPNRAAIILAVRSAERSLYAQVFDDIVETVTGASAPVIPFDIGRWRGGMAIGWLVTLVLAWLLMAGTALGRDGAGTVGRSVAALAIFLAVVAAAVVYVYLANAEASLHLANMSRAQVAVEVAGAGILVALVAWFFGALRDSTVKRVASAPSGGTFSGNAARTLSGNLVPPVQPAALTDPGHGMDEETLEASDRELMQARKPKHTLVGAPSLASASGSSSDEAFDKVWAEAQAAAEAAVDAESESEAEAEAEAEPESESEAESESRPTEGDDAQKETIVGPAPGPAEQANTPRKPKTKTEVFQFPPPMSDPKSE